MRVDVLIDEIVNAPPLPYKWLTNEVATFEFNDKPFGIVLEQYFLALPNRRVSVVNISFGVVINQTLPISANNIDRNLTGFGKPRTVMSTVADACVNNPSIRKNDMFVVAASEQVEQRLGIYTLAISELDTKLRDEYKFSYRAHTPNNSTLIVTSKIQLTQEEVELIGKELLGK